MTKADSRTPRRAALFGAASGIAEQAARLWAERGDRLVLVARDAATLERIADDLKVRGAAQAETIVADFAALESLGEVAAKAWAALGGLDVALVAYGTLPDQKRTEADPAALQEALLLNFASPAALVNILAARFEAQGAGTLAVITSVAGDRGRQSNYAYGAAKGGLQHFLEGLRHRLQAASVRVLDVRPGFVATRMTAHLPRGGPLWAAPEKVAKDIVAAVDGGREVLYTPAFWRGIMLAVRSLPRPLFHRTKL
jgi:decaprenylphospho-beta-D-erythro-pentofuranosid-2-ulose 2-reductase